MKYMVLVTSNGIRDAIQYLVEKGYREDEAEEIVKVFCHVLLDLNLEDISPTSKFRYLIPISAAKEKMDAVILFLLRKGEDSPYAISAELGRLLIGNPVL